MNSITFPPAMGKNRLDWALENWYDKKNSEFKLFQPCLTLEKNY